MNREERVRILIDYLKKENTGYASLADPVDYTGRRRLLRSLMNVRWPGEADPEYTRIQDELLKEEAEQKGIVEWGQLPTIGSHVRRSRMWIRYLSGGEILQDFP